MPNNGVNDEANVPEEALKIPPLLGEAAGTVETRSVTGLVNEPVGGGLDEDWFQLQNAPGTYTFSVLGQYVVIEKKDETGATTRTLLQTTTVGAEIYEKVILADGKVSYKSVQLLEMKQDTIAPVKYEATSGYLSFASGEVTLKAPHTALGEERTGEYFIKVLSGGGVNGLLSAAFTGGLPPERYLITEGNPTGQRDLLWGVNWVPTLKPIIVPEPVPPTEDRLLSNAMLLAEVPTLQTVITVDGGRTTAVAEIYNNPSASMPGWTYRDPTTDTFTPIGSMAGTEVSEEKVEAAIVANLAAEEATEQLEEELEEQLGSSFIQSIDGAQKVNEIRKLVTEFHSDLFQMLEAMLKSVTATSDPKTIDTGADLQKTVDEFQIDGIGIATDASERQTRLVKNVNSLLRSMIGGTSQFAGSGEIRASATRSAGDSVSVTVLSNGFDDKYVGDSYANALDLGDGNDIAFGGAGNDTLRGGAGDDMLMGGNGDDTLVAGTGNDVLEGDSGNDTLDVSAGGTNTVNGGAGVDRVIFAGSRSAYTIAQTANGNFTITGPEGAATLHDTEYAHFADQTVRLLPGSGAAVDFSAASSSYMAPIRDFDGNNLTGQGTQRIDPVTGALVGSGAWDGVSGWSLAGTADVNGSGAQSRILFNNQIGRWAEVTTQADGKVYFSNNGWAGDTRIVGIYIDPLVQSGAVIAGGPHDSQRRFQNDLFIGNLKSVLNAGDYDKDGAQEIYFSLTDGTAYLHTYMHADGNIRYANYQSKQQVQDYLAANGYSGSTGWLAAAPPEKLAATWSDDAPPLMAAAEPLGFRDLVAPANGMLAGVSA